MVLTKEQVLAELRKRTSIGTGRVVFKVLDYTGNAFAPERTAYRVHYTDAAGTRRRVTYYPGTVGVQWG